MVLIKLWRGRTQIWNITRKTISFIVCSLVLKTQIFPSLCLERNAVMCRKGFGVRRIVRRADIVSGKARLGASSLLM